MVCEGRVEVEEDGEALAGRLSPALAGMSLGLVGPGQFYARADQERVTLLWVEPGPPRVVWDGPVLRAEVAALRQGLAARAGVLAGEVDTMHATALSFAWSVAPAPALVVDDQGVVLRARGDGVELRGRDLVAPARLRRVEALISDDWVQRDVELVLAPAADDDGPEVRVTLATCREFMAAADPTYDGISLLFDGGWAPAMARAVAAALAVPVQLAPAYR